MARVELKLFGFPAARLDAHKVNLSLRKGLGLLAYVADVCRPVGRDVMASLLWPESDSEEARGSLRRTLHKIHIAFQANVICADRTSLILAPSLAASIDTHEFETACDTGEMEKAGQLYSGDFLEGLSIEGCPAFDEWAFFRREALRSRLVQVLERQIERALVSSAPAAAIPAAVRLVGLDPLSETAQRHLISAYMRTGDRAAAERQYESCARVLAVELGVAPDPQTKALLSPRRTSDPAPAGRTLYTQHGGLHLAYQVVGNGPIDILLVPGFVSHVERIWEEPRSRALLTALSKMGRLILFDRRGVGLSDRVGAPPTVEATAKDLMTVMDAAGSGRVLLIGMSEGGPSCIHFAAKHPQRLTGLVLYGSLAKGVQSTDYPFVLTRAQYERWLKKLVKDWGGPTGIETFAPSLVGDRQAEGWWSGLLRAASSPGAIKAVLEALRDTDVRTQLPLVQTPTLVLHRRDDHAVRIEAGRHLATSIPGAKFIELDGADHWLWAGDQEAALQHICRFADRLHQ